MTYFIPLHLCMESLGGSEGNFDLHANFTAKLLEENVSLIFKLFSFISFLFLF